jgi:predicted GNAT family acetyltransferase
MKVVMKEDISVELEEEGHRGAFFVEREGRRLAELTFSATPDRKLVILDHTEVSESLRGEGIARTLVQAAVAWARKTNVKLVPLCPFAKAVFDREPQFADVRA